MAYSLHQPHEFDARTARNTEVTRNFQESKHHKEASFDGMDYYDKKTIRDCLRNQQIALGGEGTKRNIKKYKNGNLPPVPESYHFDILSTEADITLLEFENQDDSYQGIKSAKDVQNETKFPVAINKNTWNNEICAPSDRLLLIMQERKPETQISLGTRNSNETFQTIPFPMLRNKKREIYSSVKVPLSDRMCQIMKVRKKEALILEPEAIGSCVVLHSNIERKKETSGAGRFKPRMQSIGESDEDQQ